jgi:hypothetical protein
MIAALLLLAVLLVLGASSAASVSPAMNSPLTGLVRGPPGAAPIRGRVEQRIVAGSYTYLALRTDDAALRWAVTLGDGAPAGTRIAIRSVGRSPRFDPESGKLRVESGETYTVSSTYGTPKPGADGKPVMDRYYALFGAIQTQLESQPGLLALWLSQSPACGSGRTLALWKSEELMYDFVFSPPHLAAMNAVEDVLQPGYAVTHWEASMAEQVTFDEAVRQLAKAGVSP